VPVLEELELDEPCVVVAAAAPPYVDLYLVVQQMG